MLRSALLLVSVLAPIGALSLRPAGVVDEPATRLVATARQFLQSLEGETAEKARLPFDGSERTAWNFLPGVYPGAPLADLDRTQRRLAYALLRAGLGTQGLLKTQAILQLEEELRVRAVRAGREAEIAIRNAEAHSIAVFGEPDVDGTWGFRFQGHHASLNFTVVGGRAIATTPKFFGANPHEILDGPLAGLRPLAAEEDSARDLIASLSPDQLAVAVVADTAPPDIVMGPGRGVDLLGERRGLGFAAMSESQRELLRRIAATYVSDLAPALAAAQLARIERALPEAVFAWMGSTERGQPHYYRVHGPDFVFEYDNVQNSANHSHVVWHDLRDGFGRDLLRAHYEREHRRR